MPPMTLYPPITSHPPMTSYPGWPRRIVQPAQAPRIETLAEAGQGWLWLDGAQDAELEEQVVALTPGFDHHWLWRDTAWAYTPPGYRHGPLLTRVNADLLQRFVEDWAPRQMGVLIIAPGDAHASTRLQSLHRMNAPDGLPLRFSLTATRQLEELCEGLAPHRLSELMGPIREVTWRTADADGAQWLRVDLRAFDAAAPVSAYEDIYPLHDADEDAINQASVEWFMRETARRTLPPDLAATDPAAHAKLLRQLAIFTNEASEIGLVIERDVRHYIGLRLRFPQQPFEKDAVLRKILTQQAVPGLQRLHHAEQRLNQIQPALASGLAT